eukprot:7292388-Lingulodinium_polyedra.AAC.1
MILRYRGDPVPAAWFPDAGRQRAGRHAQSSKGLEVDGCASRIAYPGGRFQACPAAFQRKTDLGAPRGADARRRFEPDSRRSP